MKETSIIFKIGIAVLALVLIVGALVALVDGVNNDSASWFDELIEFFGGDSSAGSGGNKGDQTEADVPKKELDSKCVHNFDEGVTVKAASCFEKGTLRKTCTKCKGTDDFEIPFIDHKFTKLYNGGSDYHYAMCEVCENVNKDVTFKHDFTVVTSEATCTVVGKKVSTCPCGYVVTETLPVLAHVKSDFIDVASDNLNHSYLCKLCGKTFNESHHYGAEEVITSPTCEVNGLSTQECSDCGHIKKNVLIGGHDYFAEQWGSESYHMLICNLCGAKTEDGHSDYCDFEFANGDFHYASCGLCGQIVEQAHYVIIDADGKPSCPWCRSDLG